jgi:hypothetical protein
MAGLVESSLKSPLAESMKFALPAKQLAHVLVPDWTAASVV